MGHPGPGDLWPEPKDDRKGVRHTQEPGLSSGTQRGQPKLRAVAIPPLSGPGWLLHTDLSPGPCSLLLNAPSLCPFHLDNCTPLVSYPWGKGHPVSPRHLAPPGPCPPAL